MSWSLVAAAAYIVFSNNRCEFGQCNAVLGVEPTQQTSWLESIGQ